MKKFIKLLSVLMVLLLTLSSLALTASASEFADYYETPMYYFGDTDFDEKVTVKDATAIQKHLAKIITLSEDALYFGDVDGNEKITISDATLIQKYVAMIIEYFPVEEYAPDYACLADGSIIDIELTIDAPVEVMVTVEEEGFYAISATTGGETTLYLDFTSEDMEGYWVAESDGETYYILAKLNPGVYCAYMFIENGLDTNVQFAVSPSENAPFDIEGAVELNIGDKLEVKAGKTPITYKVDISQLENADDELIVYIEGENPLVSLACYDGNYNLNNEGYDDGTGNTTLSVYNDGENTEYYVVVNQDEGGSDFTVCCDTSFGMLKREAKDIELGTADEIVVEEFTEEFEGETFTYYAAQAVYRFTPDESGYYSVNFESSTALGVMAVIADLDNVENSYIYVDMSEEGGRLFDVRYLEAGVEYYIIGIVEPEEKGNVIFTVLNSTEEEYLEAQQRYPFEDATPDETEYTEISLGETVTVELEASESDFDVKNFVFTAEEDATVVLYSEGSDDACVYIYDDSGMLLHMSDDIPLFESLDFAAIGTVAKGETVYFSLVSYTEATDSFTFTIVNEADYVPLG